MRVLPLKRFVDPARPITYGIVQAGPDCDGGVPYIRPVDMRGHDGVDPAQLRTTSHEIADQYRRSVVRPGDLVISIGPSFGKTMIVPATLAGANLTQGTARVAPSRGVDVRYLRWAVRSNVAVGYWDAAVGGATFRALNLEPLARTPIPPWPLDDQRAIADYLDAETARIDRLIAKKRRLIELLDERFGAAIRHDLQSLDAPWLPLKRRWRVIDCKHRTPGYLDDGYPVVSPGDTTPGRLDLSRCHRFVGEVDYLDLARPPRRPERGDIIYSRNASIGIASYVDTDERFCMGQDVCLITSSGQDQLFLTYALNTVGVDQLDEAKIGSTFNRVNISQILEMSVPCPNLAVQREVAQRFDARARLRDIATATLGRQVDLLVERRQALITAAVTGEIVVSGRAA